MTAPPPKKLHDGTAEKYCSITTCSRGEGGGNDLHDTMMDEAVWLKVGDDSSLATIEKNNSTIINTRIGAMFSPQPSTKEPNTKLALQAHKWFQKIKEIDKRFALFP